MTDEADAAMADWEEQEDVDLASARFPVAGKVGDEKILIFKVGTGYRGVQQKCPHQEIVLIKANIIGNKRIRCPLHSYIFELSDGRGVNCPTYKMRVYEVREEDGKVLARAAN